MRKGHQKENGRQKGNKSQGLACNGMQLGHVLRYKLNVPFVTQVSECAHLSLIGVHIM